MLHEYNAKSNTYHKSSLSNIMLCVSLKKILYSFTDESSLLFAQMFRTSFGSSQVRCEVQKSIIRFTNRFVN